MGEQARGPHTKGRRSIQREVRYDTVDTAKYSARCESFFQFVVPCICYKALRRHSECSIVHSVQLLGQRADVTANNSGTLKSMTYAKQEGLPCIEWPSG
jgi:hypothetical protein